MAGETATHAAFSSTIHKQINKSSPMEGCQAIGAGTAAAMAHGYCGQRINSYHGNYGNYGITLNQQWVLVTQITKVLSLSFPDFPVLGPRSVW
jgi:hypothetical protein